ncbi:MAG: transposase, partial [Bacteroidales bacterium]|nr:transposase [Bacteroidales bacterium]
PFTIHHSPLTIHHSPFTTHHSPFRPQGSLRSPWAGIRQAYGPFGRCLVFLCEIGGCLGCVDFIFVSLTGWFLGCFVLLSICFPQFWLYFQHTKKQQFSTFYYCFNSYICGKKNVMSHSLSKIIIHAVWHIKKNSPEILKENRTELYQFISGTLEKNKCVPLRINGTGNHVHVLFILSRTLSIAKIMEILKSHSTNWIKRKGLHYKDFSWQGGYGTFSVSESVSPTAKRYIDHQEEHHRQITPKNELIQLLTKNKVPFDEQYILDE